MSFPTVRGRQAVFALAAAAIALLGFRSFATDLNQPPIRYDESTPDNLISRFKREVATGRVKLAFEEDRGYLKSVLAGLKIPESSQVLVFSKTSLQRGKISPKTPRAIYFNDDIYIGFCLRGDVMEVSVADPELGTVFYTLDQEPTERPRFARQTESCMICHASSSTRGVPGHLVRSVYPDRGGEPILGSGSYRTDDTSPYEQRWGGWYVTGKHGKLDHLGNRMFRGRYDSEESTSDEAARNVTDLKPFFTTGPYLTPHSDVVALMVLSHQVAVHNRIARAILETRSALYYQDELNKALKEAPNHKYESVQHRIESAGEDLVKAMFFCGEAELTDRVEGTTAFAKEFASRGPFDKAGRTLRAFDLNARLFKYPCSFLVYTESFDKMPAPVKDYVLRRMHAVLTGKENDKVFSHLSVADRAAILQILRETKPDLPAYWRE